MDMTATITFPTKRTKTVKNLGWLLRHGWMITHFHVDMRKDSGAVLRAYVRDGRVFTSDFASREVLWGWLHRPLFSGTPLTWDGYETTIRLAMKYKYPQNDVPEKP